MQPVSCNDTLLSDGASPSTVPQTVLAGYGTLFIVLVLVILVLVIVVLVILVLVIVILSVCLCCKRRQLRFVIVTL